MTLRGEEIASPYKKWLENEVGSVASVRTDLGKFFFGVSTGTVAFFLSLEKTGLKIKLDNLLVTSLFFCIASMVVALFMAKPPLWTLDENTDIFVEHDRHVVAVRRFMLGWFILWLLALTPWTIRLLFAA